MDDPTPSETVLASGGTYDSSMIEALDEVVIDWRHKSIPANFQGLISTAFSSGAVSLGDLQTPLLTLDRTAMTHNLEQMAKWCTTNGVLLAPHGKTTMAPQLWAEQLDSGAWGITLANSAQLRVAHAFGISKVHLANTLSDPRAITWVATVAGDGFEVVSWVDSVQSVRLLDSTLARISETTGNAPSPLRLLVELGGAGGRTGARTIETVLEIARAVADSPHLLLVGIGGYEGALAHSADADALETVRDYLTRMLEAHQLLNASGHYAPNADLMLSAGGSAYFDDVVSILSPAIDPGTDGGQRVDVMIRSGAYLVHDDGFYRSISPFTRHGDTPFRSAMHGWARVVSQPEPGLALLDGGKRDFPYDEGLPEPQLIGPDLGQEMSELVGASIKAQNDQHSFLRFDPETTTVNIGDVVRLGLSHPCTAFDKWSLIPVLQNSDSNPPVVSLVHTFF